MACFLVHCSRCETETLPTPSASAVAPEPPAAPRRLLAEFVVPRPGAVWSVARDLAAAYSPVLPREGALALAHGLGLPVTAAGLFELTAPITGVLTLDAQGQVVPTFAIPVKSGRELVATLTTGAAPLFAAEASSSGVTALAPKAPKGGLDLAVFRNTVVVSSVRGEARQNARFLVEVVRERPRPDAALAVTAPESALDGPLTRLLRARWHRYRAGLREEEAQARRERGRPPDFADPEAVLALLDGGVEALLAVLATSKELTVEVRFEDRELSLSVETLPKAAGPAKDLVQKQITGSAEPLGSLPAETALAVLSRSAPAARSAAAHDVERWLERLFGARLPEADRARVVEHLEQFARGRGDHASVALIGGDSPVLLAQGALGDPTAFEVALVGLPNLLKVKAIADPLTHFLGPIRSASVRPPLAGQAVRGHAFSFDPRGALSGFLPAGLSVFWSTQDGGYRLVLGGPGAHARLRPPAAQSLNGLPGVRSRLARIESASFVALARPVLLGLMPEAPRGDQEPLISISAGRRGDKGFVHTTIPNEVIRYYATKPQ